MIGAFKVLISIILLGLTLITTLRVKKKNDDIGVEFHPAPLVIGLFFTVLFWVLSNSIGSLQAGNRGVVLRFGAVTGRTLGEGIYMVTPFVESVEIMSVQVEAYSAEAEAVSKDLQQVKTTVTLNYALDPVKVGTVYQTLGRNYEDRIIKPAIQESVKASTAQYDAESLVSKRAIVKQTIQDSLKVRLATHGILVDQISITDFQFTADFMKAVEEKVTATQLAMKAKNDLERIRMEAQQKVVTAQAEAESLRIQKEQVTPQLIALRQLDVQRTAIAKWNGALPTYLMMGGSGGAVPVMDIFQMSK